MCMKSCCSFVDFTSPLYAAEMSMIAIQAHVWYAEVFANLDSNTMKLAIEYQWGINGSRAPPVEWKGSAMIESD